ncbi:hypothetical protein [Paraburkholderia dioscoreae]|uniref:hypothetical protein n=1 Tax=Paraburkholderia dioscoreae TaxID=2604047 RepID=UPI0013EC212F|nr:hypothetical protein [Paraburkholderia dioscoreae]
MASFRLTPKKFELLDATLREQASQRAGRRFGEKSRLVAYAVIVEGGAPTAVAREYEVTPQWVSQVITRYHAGYLAMDQAEGDAAILWLNHGFELPNTLVKPLTAFLNQARRCKDPKKIQSAIAGIIKAINSQSSKLE